MVFLKSTRNDAMLAVGMLGGWVCLARYVPLAVSDALPRLLYTNSSGKRYGFEGKNQCTTREIQQTAMQMSVLYMYDGYVPKNLDVLEDERACIFRFVITAPSWPLRCSESVEYRIHVTIIMGSRP